MALKAGVGVSEGTETYIAAARAAQEAMTQLDAETPSAVIVFASSVYDQQKVVEGVRSVTGDALLVGSSTAGEITTIGPAPRQSVAVMVLQSDSIQFHAAVGENIAAGPRDAGKRAAEAVKQMAGEPLKAFMMIPDVLAGNGAEIVRGVLDSLGEHFPVVGGASGDDFKFQKTYQYLNDRVLSGSVVGLGMSGNLKIGIGVKHGWTAVGMPRTVTKSEGTVLHELDGKPAISIYEDYFGPDEAAHLRNQTLAKLAITYPLGMRAPQGEEMLIRDPLTVDEHGSITCAAEIPQGSEIQLMVGSREEAVQVAAEAARNACEQLDGNKPSAIVIFNCIARSKLFGERSGDEINAIQKELGETVPLIGFYTYGEQAPLGGEVRNLEKCNPAFHNETVVICALAESA